LAENILKQIDRKQEWVRGTLHNADGSVTPTEHKRGEELEIDCIRRDEVPGIHSITYNSEADCITITHDAHNRKGFALGAVLAAEYTAQHHGLLTMSDMFDF
jgi:4-hydroxy-tetrahydrodipicolinate reductase